MPHQEMFSPYRMVERVWESGFATTWLAVDTRRDRSVLVKVLREHLIEHDGKATARFRRESEIAGRLSGRHLVPVHDYGSIDGRQFIEMQHVEGVDLKTLLARNGALPLPRATEIVAQVGTALETVHAAGIVHRDVKPSNVVLASVRAGEPDFVYVVDFAIAAALSDEPDEDVIGTLNYMAPERFADPPYPHDVRTDVYGLACVLYEALTTQGPFPVVSGPDLIRQHMSSRRPRPSAVVPGLSPDVDAVVARGMAVDPSHRYSTVGELVLALRSAGARRPMPARVRDGVFVSYRRADTFHVAARLSEKIAARLDEDRVFLDVASIAAGQDFTHAVGAAIARSAVMLVVIGPGWLGATAPDGRRRLDDPRDNVRIEVEAGLAQGLLVVPVLVDGVSMPKADALPGALAPLTYRNALRIEQSTYRRDDVAVINLVVGRLARAAPTQGRRK